MDPIPVGNDATNDAYAMIPIQLDWTNIGGTAYSNPATGVKVTHYPVIHARKGSMGYKVEWTPPGTTNLLTMIYSSDTKPETNSVNQACNGGKGVDVFIHEMVDSARHVGLETDGTQWRALPGRCELQPMDEHYCGTDSGFRTAPTPRKAPMGTC